MDINDILCFYIQLNFFSSLTQFEYDIARHSLISGDMR